MRKLLYGLGVLAAIAVLAVLAWIVGLPLRFPFSVEVFDLCTQDDEIPADERTSIEAAALDFVRALVSTDPAAAYSQMSSGAQRNISRDAFLAFAHDHVQWGRPFEKLHVTETFLIRLASTSDVASVTCGKPGRAEDWVTVTAAPMPKQAYALLEAQGRDNGWVFVLWLKPEQPWRVAHVQSTIETSMGRSAQDYRAAARSEQSLGHQFNTVLLYTIAVQLADRGPHFQLGIQPEIQRELAALELPALLRGQAPFTWHFQDKTFRVLQVGPIGVRGKNYVTLTHEVLPWTKDSDADKQNRDLIREFARAVPEYMSAFAGLLVVAQEKGGSRTYLTYDPPVEQAK